MAKDMNEILVVDDSRSVRESLRMIFKDNFRVRTLSFSEAPLSLTKTEGIDLVILGVSDPLDGKIELLQRLIEYNEGIAVLLLMEHKTSQEVVDLFDYSICDFVSKPFSVYDVREKAKSLLNRRKSVPPLSKISHTARKIARYRRIYKSPLLEQRVATVVAKTLHNDMPVLIHGENGSGHELTSKIIHYNGLRKEAGFFKLNCGTLIGESLINTLLAIAEDRSSKTAGTLFLEEIGQADLDIQMRLMGIIEEGTIATKGREEVALDLRVIASTSKDLSTKVNNGEFREDLFYRLSALPISLSPLRERREDIPMIANYILNDLSQRMKIQRKRLSSDAVEVLKNYYWPGNLVELESVVARSAILADGEIISGRDLSFGIEDTIITIPSEDQKFEEYRYVKSEKENRIDFSFDTLITNLAHEVKNPLVSIKAFTQLLPERFEDTEFRGEFYEIVGQNVNRIDGIIEAIVDYTQFSRPKFGRVNVQTLIEKVLEKHLGNLAEVKSGVLKEFEQDLPHVLSDRDQLQYTLDNIFSKVISMVPEGRNLSLSVRIIPLNW
ncbi:MAG: sigma 54-interacting transcriptional regulator, partial [Pseudomonadota bacterium]